MALTTGDVIDGKYRIIRLIGEGGMGAVYEGENLRIHRRVAIKVLHSGVAENQDAVQRFEREAQAAGRIGSEHIVEVLDLGNLPDGDRFMVMEFMDGDSLSARIQARGRLTARQTFPIARQILEALAAAHGAGIIHRDLKPDNVFLLKSRGGHVDFVKLLDFGISKFSQLSGESGFSMTRTGSVMGTPYYMSPEQAKGAKGMDHRADLYAVGVILYECVTGRVPFNADTFNELLFKIVLETPQPIEQVVADSDPEFNKIVQRAMAREPGLRYQTAREFQQALDAWSAGQPVAGLPLGSTPQPMQPGASMLSSGSMGRMTPPAASSSVMSKSGSGPLPQSGTMSAMGPPGSFVEGASPPMRTGTPGTWANNTGPSPFVAQEPKKSSTPLIIATAAGVLLLVGGGVAAVSMRGGSETPPAPVVAAQPPGPTPEQLAEEAKRTAELEQRQKGIEEKIKKAEEEARAAEARAKKAEASAKEQAEADEAREKVKALKAAVPVKPAAPKAEHPAAPAAPAAQPAPPKQPEPAQQSGRRIRTEL